MNLINCKVYMKVLKFTMKQKQRKVMEFAGSMFLSLAAFLIIYQWIPVVYSTNDDRMILEIVSGKFTGTPESYGIQMTYGYTWMLSRMYRLMGNLNWYGITLIGAQIFSFGTVLYRLQSFCRRFRDKLILLLTAIGIYLAAYLNVYVQLTYTSTAAFVGMAAIFWYASSKTDWKNILMVGILANLSFSIRPNVFYMLLPATGLIYLWKLIEKKERKKLTVMAPFLILTVTLALLLLDRTAYSKTGWKEFREFFQLRTDVFDYYDLLPYEEYPQLYEPYGITEDEYDLMRIYDYTILEELPKEFFPQYLEAVKAMEREQGNPFFARAGHAVKEFVKGVCTNAYGTLNTILWIMAGLLFVILLRKRQFSLAFYLLIQTMASWILWLYFTFWDRAIERIQITMSLIFLAVLLHAAYEMKNTIHITGYKRWKKYLQTAALVGILFLGGLNFRNFRYQNIAKADWYQDVEKIEAYCAKDPERLYYMDVATMTELYGRCTIRQMGEEYLNYISLGDWTAYCPHYEKKLKDHNVENVAETLTDENTYVIILHNYQLQCLKDYLQAEEVWVETIWGANDTAYGIYQFHQ